MNELKRSNCVLYPRPTNIPLESKRQKIDYECINCGLIFNSKGALHNHNYDCINKNYPVCFICRERVDRSTLSDHIELCQKLKLMSNLSKYLVIDEINFISLFINKIIKFKNYKKYELIQYCCDKIKKSINIELNSDIIRYTSINKLNMDLILRSCDLKNIVNLLLIERYKIPIEISEMIVKLVVY